MSLALVRAVPVGEPVFNQREPACEVLAPILQGQLLETIVINQIGYQSLIATKAARMRTTQLEAGRCWLISNLVESASLVR